MFRIRYCILGISVITIQIFFSLSITHAEDRRMPWQSVYFRWDTLSYMKHWDAQREYLNGVIHTIANWDHAKSMALRAYLYEYCGQKARENLDYQEILGKKITPYSHYLYFQTQLYQSLQPTVTKLRTVINDPHISFYTVLEHLQSDDESMLYFYRTLPHRYNDILAEQTVWELQAALRRYYAANESYPLTLTDLITYKFLSKDIQFPENTILYRAFNAPKVEHIVYYPPTLPSTYPSTYVLVYHVEHTPNMMFTTQDVKSLRLRISTFSLPSWKNMITKKASVWSDATIGWKIVMP